MIDIVTSCLLDKLEQGEECKEIRNKIINDEFEENAIDYIKACRSINDTAEEYFRLGFTSGISLIVEANRKSYFDFQCGNSE